ncbi:hypothetical protein PCAR4_250045 [Paraburkholderia caribensis]|nr:hypothetical protein PCAR4_250045 [Paraburkholderia caribensis]
MRAKAMRNQVRASPLSWKSALPSSFVCARNTIKDLRSSIHEIELLDALVVQGLSISIAKLLYMCVCTYTLRLMALCSLTVSVHTIGAMQASACSSSFCTLKISLASNGRDIQHMPPRGATCKMHAKGADKNLGAPRLYCVQATLGPA